MVLESILRRGDWDKHRAGGVTERVEDPGQRGSRRTSPKGSCPNSWFLKRRGSQGGQEGTECTPLPHSKPLPEGENRSDGHCLQCHVANCTIRTQAAQCPGQDGCWEEAGGGRGKGGGAWRCHQTCRESSLHLALHMLSSPLWLPVLKPPVDGKCEYCHFNGSGCV